jgi:hypothetical protein
MLSITASASGVKAGEIVMLEGKFRERSITVRMNGKLVAWGELG